MSAEAVREQERRRNGYPVESGSAFDPLEYVDTLGPETPSMTEALRKLYYSLYYAPIESEWWKHLPKSVLLAYGEVQRHIKELDHA